MRFPASAPRFWDDTQYILFADSAPVPAATATATPKEKLRADVPDGSVQSIQTISGGAVGAGEILTNASNDIEVDIIYYFVSPPL